MNITLLIPDLLPPLVAAKQQAVLDAAELPALSYLLSRSQQQLAAPDHYAQQLMQLFNVPSAASIAHITSQIDRLPATYPYWLRADPCEFQLQSNAVILMGKEHLDLLPHECEQLLALINPLLLSEGMELVAAPRQRWYLGMRQKPTIKTEQLFDVLGKNIYFHLPKGDDKWHTLLTEIQMVLNDCEVNLARRQQGRPEINGLWLWGEGEPVAELHTNFDKVIADDEIARGLAALANVPVIKDQQVIIEFGEQDILFYHLGLLRALMLDGIDAWCEHLLVLEKDLFSTLQQQYRSGEVQQLVIRTGGQYDYTLVGKTRFYFWRKQQPISHFL